MTSPEMVKEKLRNEIVPVPTLFKEDLSLDLGAMEAHLEFLFEKGVKCLYLARSASEFEWLSCRERLAVAECVLKKAAGRAVVIAQPLGSGWMGDHLEEARELAALGADALVVMPIPIKTGGAFFSCKYKGGKYQPEIHHGYYMDYMDKMADETGAPLVFHNKPFDGGVALCMKTMSELVERPYLAAIKEHNPDPGVRHKIFEAFGDKVICFDGFGKISQLWSLLWGAKARHTCWSWFDPERDQEFTASALSGDVNRAVRITQEEWPVTKAILETGFAGYKALMEFMGLPGGPVRVPGQGIDEAGRQLVKTAAKEMGLLT